jgi:hypothetical protein
MPDSTIKFTPEEVDYLLSSGMLTTDMFPKLDPEMQKMAIESHIRQRMQTIPVMPTALGGATSQLVPGLLGMAGSVAKTVAPPVVQAAFSAAGHPWLGLAVGHTLGRGMGGRRGTSAPAPSSPPASMTGTGFSGAPISSGSNGFSSRPTGTAGSPPPAEPAPPPNWTGTATSPFQPMSGGWSGLTRPAQSQSAPASNPDAANTLLGKDPWAEASAQSTMLGARPTPPNVTRIDPRPSRYSGLRNPAAEAEIAEQAPRGVQNDFRGRVSFQRDKPAAKREFPPGANSKTPPNIYRQLEEAYAESQGNPAEVEAIRRFIAKALESGK